MIALNDGNTKTNQSNIEEVGLRIIGILTLARLIGFTSLPEVCDLPALVVDFLKLSRQVSSGARPALWNALHRSRARLPNISRQEFLRDTLVVSEHQTLIATLLLTN